MSFLDILKRTGFKANTDTRTNEVVVTVSCIDSNSDCRSEHCIKLVNGYSDALIRVESLLHAIKKIGINQDLVDTLNSLGFTTPLDCETLVDVSIIYYNEFGHKYEVEF